MKKALFLAAVTALLIVSARADQVNLKDGSVVKGKVVQILDGKLTIKTDSLGEMKIDFNKIANFTTDEPMVVSTTTSAATGNTEKTTVGGSAKATLAGPDDKLELYVRGHYAKENGVKNEQEIVAGADYERRLNGGSHSLYARLQAEQDKFDNYRLYTTAAAGYGFYLLDKEDFKVRLRAGLTYIHKTYYEELDDSDDIGVEFGYHHELNIRKLTKIDAKTMFHCALIGITFFLAMLTEMMGLQTTPSSVTRTVSGASASASATNTTAASPAPRSVWTPRTSAVWSSRGNKL